MSRSHHVTNKQLKKERSENAVTGCDSSEITELEEKDLKKDISKVNATWSRQAARDQLRSGLKMRLKNKKIEVI